MLNVAGHATLETIELHCTQEFLYYNQNGISLENCLRVEVEINVINNPDTEHMYSVVFFNIFII